MPQRIRVAIGWDTVYIVTFFDVAGERVRNGLNAPRPYEAWLLRGSISGVVPANVPEPELWLNHVSDYTPGSRAITLDAIRMIPFPANAPGHVGLVSSAPAVLLCALPKTLEMLTPILTRGLAEDIVSTGTEGAFVEKLDRIVEAPHDPSTRLPVDRGVAQLTAEVVQDAVLRDLKQARGTTEVIDPRARGG